MDTNPFLPEDIYPVAESTEEAVEAYCQAVFENNSVLENVFPNLQVPLYHKEGQDFFLAPLCM